MIIALEGVDGVGKTTIFNLLKKELDLGVRFLGNQSVPPELYPHMTVIQEREIKLFESMYEINRTYLADRFFSVSEPVYANVFGRRSLDVDAWITRTVVFYLYAPAALVQARLLKRGENLIKEYGQIVNVQLAYKRILESLNYPYRAVYQFDATRRPEDLVGEMVNKIIREM